MRCADFGPIPGRRPSSSIKVCTGPSYGFTMRRSEGLLGTGAEQPAEAAEAAEHRVEIKSASCGAELRGLHLLGLAHRIVDRGHDEVLERLDVSGIDHARIDRDAA